MRAGPDRDMRLAEYESIRAHLLSLPCARYPDMDVLKASHPGVSLDTLVSISSQESSRRIKAHHGRHARQIEVHASRYLSGEDIFHVAHDVDFPPCQLLRLLIEHLLGVGHKAVGALLRDPHDKIPRRPPPESPGAIHHAGDETAQADLCARITADVVRCVAWDHVASPAVDASRRVYFNYRMGNYTDVVFCLQAHRRPRVRRLTRRYKFLFISVWVNRLTPFFFLFKQKNYTRSAFRSSPKGHCARRATPRPRT